METVYEIAVLKPRPKIGTRNNPDNRIQLLPSPFSLLHSSGLSLPLSVHCRIPPP